MNIIGGYEIPFYFASKAIKATKFVSVNKISHIHSESGGPGRVEEGCYSSLGYQRGSTSQFVVSFEKKEMGESPSGQPKGPEQQYSILALQDGMVVPIKGNLFTRGQNVKDGPGGCILCNSLVSEIQEVCQISVERPSIRVLLPLLRIFSSSSGLCKVIKGPYLSLEKAQCKDKNLPRQHPPNRIFIRGLVDFKRYTDIHTLTFTLLEKCPNTELFTNQYGPVITLHLDTFHTVL